MSRLFNPDFPAVESWELPGLFAAALRAAPSLTDLMPAGVAVYQNDESLPDADGSVPVHPPGLTVGPEWLRVVVREPVTNAPLTRDPSGTRNVPVEVLVEASRTGDTGWNPRQMIAAAHAAVVSTLVGRTFTLTYATQMLPVTLGSPAPSAALDGEADIYYARAVYRVLLAPFQIP